MTPPIGSRATFASLSVAASLMFASWAAAITVNLAPSKDNTLIETPVGNSNGAGDGIYAGRVGTLGGGTKRRGLLAFALSSIPAGSTVDAVTLRLEMAQSPNATARIVTLHRVSADWGEAGSLGSGSGDAALSGDATWLFRIFDTLTWTTAGGDFAAGSSASQSVTDIGPYVWTGAGLVADVQFWVDNAASNFGWLLMGDEATTFTVKKFYSGEGLTPPPAHSGLHAGGHRCPLGSGRRSGVVLAALALARVRAGEPELRTDAGRARVAFDPRRDGPRRAPP